MNPRSALRVRTAALVLALAFRTTPTLADEPSAVVPPTLLEAPDAVDPRGETEAPRAEVELELDVTREGTVSAAKVVRSAGDVLDAAAVAAALAFRFEPATREGTPIAARIRYVHVFAAKAPALSVEPVPAPEPRTAPEPPPPASPAAAPEPDDAFVAKARVEVAPRAEPKRTLEREEMSRLAGTRGDPIRAVELLPGVSRPASLDGTPILRGANPDDSQVFIEGVPVPSLYHLGGLTSVVHSRVLERVDLYPSNFSVRYGRKAGGVVEVRLRDPREDHLHGIVDLSLLDSSLVVETPLGDKAGVLAAVRRSNIDAVLNAATNTADLAITAAPVYWDYQSVATLRPTPGGRLRLVAYGSSDRMRLVLKNAADVDPALRGSFGARSVFHRVQIGYRHRTDAGTELSTELTYGRTQFVGAFGSFARSNFDTHNVQGRAEVSTNLSSRVRIAGGLDLYGYHVNGDYSGIAPTTGEGVDAPNISSQGRVSIQAAQWIRQPGAYFEVGVRPFPQLLITPGVRADYNDQVGRGSVDGRTSARWELDERTVLEAGAGTFTQQPSDYMAAPPIGNPNLRLTRALHTSAGVERTIAEGVTVSAGGFAKWLDRVVTGTADGRAPYFTNDQRGRIFGGELLLRLRPRGRFFGFASYTLMRSERQDAGESYRLFDRDQPHILAVAGAYRLGRGWEVGASFRYSSGAPYTPVVASSYDARTDVYDPRYGARLSERNPGFSRLDLRVEKRWTFQLWSLAMYLDVQNVLNAPNREGFAYNYDYSAREGVRGLPIFPSLGLRGEL